jgi:hypothetical protein
LKLGERAPVDPGRCFSDPIDRQAFRDDEKGDLK